MEQWLSIVKILQNPLIKNQSTTGQKFNFTLELIKSLVTKTSKTKSIETLCCHTSTLG